MAGYNMAFSLLTGIATLVGVTLLYKAQPMTPVSSPALPPPATLPGDISAKERLHRIVRVDHAGEYGARRIYQGQLAVLDPRSAAAAKIRQMAKQECKHLEEFNRQIAERHIRPTALLPFWHVVGFALGAATASMGVKAAMACTIAIEETIDKHYARQCQQLGPEEAELSAKIEQFRQEEVEHRDTGEANGGMEIPGYRLFSGAIKAGSHLAIWLSERF